MIKNFYYKIEKFQGKCWFSFDKLFFCQKTMSPSKFEANLWLVDNFQVEKVSDSLAVWLFSFFVWLLQRRFLQELLSSAVQFKYVDVIQSQLLG